VEWNSTTAESPVSEIFDERLSLSHRILHQQSLGRSSSATETRFLELRDGTICAVLNSTIKILSKNGGCLYTFGLVGAAKITSMVELTTGSLTFGLDDGRIVTLNRLSR